MLSIKSKFRLKDTTISKVKEWKNIYHTHSNHRKPGVATLVSVKMDFKTKIKRSLEKKRYIL